MSRRNKEIARRFIQYFWNNGDMSAADELIAEDFVNHSPFAGFPPDREGIKEVVAGSKRALRGEYTIDDLISEGDKVTIRLTYRGTHIGEFQGIPATGNKIEFQSIVILHIKDNQIIGRWAVADSLTMMQQLGVIPTQ